MKIYLVYHGTDEEAYVERAFSTREKAVAYATKNIGNISLPWRHYGAPLINWAVDEIEIDAEEG